MYLQRDSEIVGGRFCKMKTKSLGDVLASSGESFLRTVSARLLERQVFISEVCNLPLESSRDGESCSANFGLYFQNLARLIQNSSLLTKSVFEFTTLFATR